MRVKLFIVGILVFGVGSVVLAQTAPLPHPDNLVKQYEHMAVFNTYTDPTKATDKAMKSGNWEDPTIWSNNKIPPQDARVVIPVGVAVVIDDKIPQRLNWVRVDGVLRFDPTKDTEIKVDTIVVPPNGTFEMGTKDNPVLADKTAHIQFIDRGPIDTNLDPNLLSRGLISHTKTSIYGTAKTSFVQYNGGPKAGESTVSLKEAVSGWKVGDNIVITGMLPSESVRVASTNPDFWKTVWKNEDEKRTIATISPDGKTITVTAPFQYSHVPPNTLNGDVLNGYIGNLSRNIVIDSENGNDITRRGHVMFMHTNNAVVSNVAFNNIGRTRKDIIVNDPVVENGKLKSGTGTNPRGRYSIHFHRGGTSITSNPAMITGSVVDGGGQTGWGAVNHSSNVKFHDNIIYNTKGAAFATEVSDEIGEFTHNLAIKIDGSNERAYEDLGNAPRTDTQKAREKILDHGHSGQGFWLEGQIPLLKDNVVAGARDMAIAVWTEGFSALSEHHKGNQFGRPEAVMMPQESLRNPELATYLYKGGVYGFSKWNQADGKLYVSSRVVPTRAENTTVLASRAVLGTWTQTAFDAIPEQYRTTVKGMTIWNVRETAFNFDYSGQAVLDGIKLYGSSYPALQTFTGDVGGGNDKVIKNSYFEGLDLGFETGRLKVSISDTKFDNKTNILIRSSGFGNLQGPNPGESSVSFNNVTFGNKAPGKLVNLSFEDTYVLTYPIRIYWNDKQLYSDRQRLDYRVPAQNSGANRAPTQLLGLTNQEMKERYNFVLGGLSVPADAVKNPDFPNLWLGSRTEIDRPELRSDAVVTDAEGANYVLKVNYKNQYYTNPPVALQPGRNLLTITVAGKPYGYWIHRGAGMSEQPPPETHISIGTTVDKISAQTGDILTYKVVASNNGTPGNANVQHALPASNLKVANPLAANLEFIEATDGGVFANNQVTWTIDRLASGEVKVFTFKARVK